MYEDRLSADQDFKQGSPNTKQEYYPFGRSHLFHGIVRRFQNEKKKLFFSCNLVLKILSHILCY